MLTVRRLRPDDDLEAASVLFDAYRQFYGQSSEIMAARLFLSTRLKSAQSVVYLAEWDGRAIGFMQLYPSFCSSRLAPIWIVNDLFVAEVARGQGTATALLKEAERFGRTTGAAFLQLSTAHDNVAAQRVYEANGWARDMTFRTYERPL